MSIRGDIRRGLGLAGALPVAALSRAFAGSRRSPRFVGAYNVRTAAKAAADGHSGKGYDDEEVADVSFDLMCKRAAWDYPVLFWLARLLPEYPSVLDAGGHLGTKYIAFSDLLDLNAVRWTVFDLPGIISAARARQAKGQLPTDITFADSADSLAPVDILLCSGLLQYLDTPFPDFVAALPQRPRYLLLNKVAVRDGPPLFTIERIGHGRVVYHIRNRSAWEAELAALGYDIVDSWAIPDLGHVIPTHPWRGRSESRGYMLKRSERATSDGVA